MPVSRLHPSFWQVGFLLIVAMIAATPLWADERKENSCFRMPREMVRVQVSGLADDGTLKLADGRHFVSPGIAIPSRLHPDPDMIRSAQVAVDLAITGHTLHLAQVSYDRHGRLMGPAALENGNDVTLALLQAGAGYAQPVLSSRSRARQQIDATQRCNQLYLAAEQTARGARRGIWATSATTSQTTDKNMLSARIGLFSVVEGRVMNTGATRDRIFVNFGRRWSEDFTLMVAPRDFEPIFGKGLDPAMLRGTVLRMRGVLREQGGPAIFARAAEDVTGLDRMDEERDGK